MIVVAFSVTDKANQVRFFKKTFLIANISPEIVFGMLSLTLSNTDINFLGRELRWRTYITEEALLTTRRVQLVGKKMLAAVMLDLKGETFIVYVTSLSSDTLPISPPLGLDVHLFYRLQVSGLIAEKAFTKVPTEYSDITHVFSPDLAFKLPEHIGINNHAIELLNG